MRGIKYYMLKVFALWVVIYNLFCISDFFSNYNISKRAV